MSTQKPRIYTEEQKAKKREVSRKWYAEHREYAKKRNKAYQLSHLPEFAARGRQWRSKPENWVKQRVSETRVRARLVEVPFSDDILLDLQSQLPALECPCCGKGIDWTPYSRDVRPINAPTVDRVVPSLGYVRGNVFIICMRCNMNKNDATLDEVKKIAVYIEQHAPKTGQVGA